MASAAGVLSGQPTAECWVEPSPTPTSGALHASSEWAGSPAGSSPTAPKPSGPLPAPRSSAASTPPQPSSAPPGPRCAKAFTRNGLGMPARNPEAVRQRAAAAARQRIGQPATPALDPVLAALNPGALPARPRSPAELYQWVRREEEYAVLGANVVVELYSESHARKPTARAWAIIRRAHRAHRLAANAPAAASAATLTALAAPKLLLLGISEPATLKYLSRLIGQAEYRRRSVSRGRGWATSPPPTPASSATWPQSSCCASCRGD